MRRAAVRFRKTQDDRDGELLEQMLDALSPSETLAVVRAFSYFSQLSNIAEDLHHNRRHRAHLHGAEGIRAVPARRVRQVGQGGAALGRDGELAGRSYMLRRYWPPTSNSACVICPSEQTRTASISTSNTFSSRSTAWRSRSSIFPDSEEFLC